VSPCMDAFSDVGHGLFCTTCMGLWFFDLNTLPGNCCKRDTLPTAVLPAAASCCPLQVILQCYVYWFLVQLDGGLLYNRPNMCGWAGVAIAALSVNSSSTQLGCCLDGHIMPPPSPAVVVVADITAGCVCKCVACWMTQRCKIGKGGTRVLPATHSLCVNAQRSKRLDVHTSLNFALLVFS